MNFTTSFQKHITKSYTIFLLEQVKPEIMKRFIKKKISHSNTKQEAMSRMIILCTFPIQSTCSLHRNRYTRGILTCESLGAKKGKGIPEFLLYFLAQSLPPLTIIPAYHKFFFCPRVYISELKSTRQRKVEFYLQT